MAVSFDIFVSHLANVKHSRGSEGADPQHEHEGQHDSE